MFNRTLNPLNPIYKLPSVRYPEKKPDELLRMEQRAPRDIMKVDDIIQDESVKNQTLKTRFTRTAPKNPLNCDDINHPEDYGDFPVPGFFRSGYVRRVPDQHNYDKEDVKDINNEWKFFTKRQTNPISPRYDYERSMIGRDIGDIEGSKPMPLPKLSNYVKEPLTQKKDKCGHAVPEHFPVERRQYRVINYTKDITQPLEHYATFHIPTRRQVHPLDPKY